MALASSGDIVLFKFPQTDLALGKLRPALLVTAIPSQFDDWLVCMISTQTHQAVRHFDETIDSTDPDFKISGLKATSLIRTTRIAVASEHIFVGTVGAIRIGSRVSGKNCEMDRWRLAGDGYAMIAKNLLRISQGSPSRFMLQL